MSSQPWLNHARPKSINNLHPPPIFSASASAPPVPYRPPTLRQIPLLRQPIQDLHAVLERRRVPTLRRQSIPHRHHHGVARSRQPPTEHIVRHRVAPATNPTPAVEMDNNREFPAIPPAILRQIPAIDDRTVSRVLQAPAGRNPNPEVGNRFRGNDGGVREENPQREGG